MSPNPLLKLKLNGVYSRNDLSKITGVVYIINLEECKSTGTHWITLYVKVSNDATCFDSFEVEHIPKEIKKFIGNINITINICRIQAYDSIMCGYFCIEFIYFMLKAKSFLEIPINFLQANMKRTTRQY